MPELVEITSEKMLFRKKFGLPGFCANRRFENKIFFFFFKN